MVNRHPNRNGEGFSLVELMVALLFTGLLMAGMAKIYKSSLSSFHTTAEKISAGRRNRVAIDMLSDDLNAAGMFLWDLTKYPNQISPANPGFWVNPNVSLTLSDGTVKGDQIFFYFDEALPFEGKTVDPAAGGGTVAVEGLNSSVASGKGFTNDNTAITIETNDASFAAMVKKGQRLVIKDGWPGFIVSEDPIVSGTKVTIKPGLSGLASFASGNAMQDATGAPTGANVISNPNHKANAPVTFMNMAQAVVYSIQARSIDPSDPAHLVPCLVRQQGPYTAGGLGAVTSTQVLAEDVSGMQVYLSVDGGRKWLRETASTGFSAGWTSGYRTKVEAELAAGYGRSGYTSLADPAWFREIPVLIRVDVTTRTSLRREEYGSTATPTLSYKEQTHSLVLRPRHFGLSFN
jgi:Tfp pilus assembly protein PilW